MTSTRFASVALAAVGVAALLTCAVSDAMGANRTPPIPNPEGSGFVYYKVGDSSGFVPYEDAVVEPNLSKIGISTRAALITEVPVIPKELVIGGTGETAAGSVVIEAGADIISIGSTANTDPFIAFATSFTDNGAPSLFLTTFTIPTVALVGPHIATMTATIGITDANGDGATIALDPSFANLILGDVGSVGDPGGTTVCGAGVDVGLPFAAAINSSAIQSPTAGPVIFNPSVGCDSRLFVTIAFQGSGNGDVFAFTGRFSVDPAPVPVPTVLALFGVGLVGLATMRRRAA